MVRVGSAVLEHTTCCVLRAPPNVFRPMPGSPRTDQPRSKKSSAVGCNPAEYNHEFTGSAGGRVYRIGAAHKMVNGEAGAALQSKYGQEKSEMTNIRLPFGLRDNVILHISVVQRGLACGCLCPGCGDRLVAKAAGSTPSELVQSC